MTSVTNVRGVGKALGQELSRQGIKTAQDLASADPENLIAVPRIGKRRAQALILAANQAVSDGATPAKQNARTATKPRPNSGRAVSGKSQAPTQVAEDDAEKAAADAKARKKAKAKAKAEKAAKKKKEMEAAIQKAKEKIKSKTKKDKKSKKDGKASKKDGKSKKSKKEKKKAKKK